jgi:hypothetical protein
MARDVYVCVCLIGVSVRELTVTAPSPSQMQRAASTRNATRVSSISTIMIVAVQAYVSVLHCVIAVVVNFLFGAFIFLGRLISAFLFAILLFAAFLHATIVMDFE